MRAPRKTTSVLAEAVIDPSNTGRDIYVDTALNEQGIPKFSMKFRGKWRY